MASETSVSSLPPHVLDLSAEAAQELPLDRLHFYGKALAS